ncbi:MAG: glycosyltransferase family 4 protein [Anaerolineales bacterium]|jgi:glycosyltransferase involved in cell wall biosynthesis
MTHNRSESPMLLYLLPRYEAESAEHFYHLYGFIRKLNKRIPMEVLAERVAGSLPKDLPIRPLRIRFPAFRLLEEFFRFIAARRRGVDVFYVHYSYTGAIAASIVVRLFGGKVFYWSCSLYKDFRLEPGASWIERLRQKMQERLLEASVRWCTYLVTGTPRVGEYYERHAGIPRGKIRLIPNFIEVARFQSVPRERARRILRLPARGKVVLFLHRVAPRKGAHHLTEIARRILTEAGPVTFLIAGGGPYLDELKRRVEREGLAPAFDIRGWVANKDAPMYYRAADLYLMPSEEEGFPRVLLEAMASGCPFVAFDVGGVRDILPDSLAGCVVEKGDVRAIAAASVRVLRDAGLRAAWRKAGEERARFFSEDRVLKAFLRMLDGQPLDWEKFLSAAEVDG